MRAIKHAAWLAAEGTARFAIWLDSPRVFPWVAIVAALGFVALMIGAYMQRGGVC